MRGQPLFLKYVALLALTWVLCGLYSCQSKVEQIPPDILSADKMAFLIADLKIVDAAYQTGTSPLGLLQLKNDSILSDADTTFKTRFKKQVTVDSLSLSDSTDLIENQEHILLNKEAVSEYIAKNSKSDYYRGHTGADYAFVFEKHKINREIFEYNLQYYASRPERFYPIVEKAMDILSLKLTKLDQRKPKK